MASTETVYGAGAAKARSLLELPQEGKVAFLKSFDIVMLAGEGVMWKYSEPIPNAGAAVMHLKNANKQVKFIFSDSTIMDEEYLERFRQMDITNVKSADLIHPVKTMMHFLQSYKATQAVFSICSQQVNDILQENGINVITMAQSSYLTPGNLISKVHNSESTVPPGAVLIDLNFNISYGELLKAQQYLLNDDCVLLVGSSNTFEPINRNLNAIGNAGFVNILSECSGKVPTILGKPGHQLGENLVAELNIRDPKRVLIVGGCLIKDVQFASHNGFQSILVLTGNSELREVLQLSDELKPDFYVVWANLWTFSKACSD